MFYLCSRNNGYDINKIWHERENTRLVAQAVVGAYGRLQQVTKWQVVVVADIRHSTSGMNWRVGLNLQLGIKN